DWIRFAKRIKKKVMQSKTKVNISEDELDLLNSASKSKMEDILDPVISIQKNSNFISNLSDCSDTDELNISIGCVDALDKYRINTNVLDIQGSSKLDNTFLSDHPLHQSHCIQFNTKNKNIIPNIVGGALPRRDKGDREYYCMTMLTFFKSWRRGQDLKCKDETWDDAFTSYNFDKTQVQLMNNFNIKYECLDARDDFSAVSKLKKEEIPALFSFYDAITEYEDTTELLGDDFIVDNDESKFNI